MHGSHRWKVRRLLDEASRRVAGASKTQLSFDLLNTASLLYQFGVGGWIAYGKVTGAPPQPKWAVGLVFAIAYSTAHRLWLAGRFAGRRVAAITVKRHGSLSVALSTLARHVRTDSKDVVDLDRVEHQLLVSLRYEVECFLLDNEGIYLNASLLVEDDRDPDRLRCVRRSNPEREIDRTYLKRDLVAWQAMSTHKPAVVHQLGNPEKPYESIYAYPILREEDGQTVSIGAITIDSSRAYHFEGIEDPLEVRMAPYAALHLLMLDYRKSRGLRR